ncbi:hypothetical protein A2U01_0045897 [Trifolium medium]|uniref:Secreted protein n=1 Tax=Trifolium medium TaxID=97028 RepID=A0A392QJZ8_9FABA|nr:hypothetical protein [Trifolium medium]
MVTVVRVMVASVGLVTARASTLGGLGTATSRHSLILSLVEFLSFVGIEQRTMEFKYVFNQFPLPLELLATVANLMHSP